MSKMGIAVLQAWDFELLKDRINRLSLPMTISKSISFIHTYHSSHFFLSKRRLLPTESWRCRRLAGSSPSHTAHWQGRLSRGPGPQVANRGCHFFPFACFDTSLPNELAMQVIRKSTEILGKHFTLKLDECLMFKARLTRTAFDSSFLP